MIKKIKAGALQLVTFIIVVIALLLSSFIIVTHIHKQYRTKTNHIIETVGLVDKGITYALQHMTSQNDTVSLTLNDGYDYKSVKTHSAFWGTFKKVHSKAKIKNTALEKTALVGSNNKANTQTALYLKDNNIPLVLVGHTKIKGKAYLPKRGVKSGNITGTSYYGDNYIYGSMGLSKSFPKIDTELLTYIQTINETAINVKGVEHIDINASKHHINSFESHLKLMYSSTELRISNSSISGHIIIQSLSKIVVEPDAKLKDVLLIAPEIEIRSHVNGAFQAFATKKISVAKHVTLNYPSAIVLHKDYLKDESELINTIHIADNSIVKGNILALGSTLPSNYEAQIKIDPNAIVKGSIYCEQNLELRGTVYGKVYTNNFIIKEAGSIYQNHLYNAIINPKSLEIEFVGLPLETSKSGIAKWLY